jgi:S-adenosylmethionine:tRNA ribosyltransferase-isomerase
MPLSFSNAIMKAKAEPLALKDFQYELPERLIAQEPTATRDGSRLLQLDRASNAISHHIFSDLIELLKPSDVLVVNDTRVIPARLVAVRKSGGVIKLLLLKPEANAPGVWQAMVSPIKRLRPNETLSVETPAQTWQIKIVDIITGEDGHKRLLVHLGTAGQVFELLRGIGYAPLPPYIARDFSQIEESGRQHDLERYQTVFAQAPGAVAAPTAGLHFSTDLLNRLTEKGVTLCKVTLHVGPGTFKPISDSIESHYIEPEQFSIPAQTAEIINCAKAEGRRVIAVGTTTCRALESATTDGELRAISDGSTSLYIRPGFEFKIIDGLITNFHLSGSSLLLLVAAFVGRDTLMEAYEVAVANEYRFFSYGDAMFIA